jgi:hypothetical protein
VRKIKPSLNRRMMINMVTKTSKWSAASAEKEFSKLAGDLVGEKKSSRFSGSPPADKKQAAADLKAMTAEPKAAPVKFRYGRT